MKNDDESRQEGKEFAALNRAVSRRQFLKLLGATGVGVGAASILPRYGLTGMQTRSNPCSSGGQQTGGEGSSLDGQNNPEGIPVPDVAQGLDVGAKAGIEKEEFHDGPFHDITEAGASTSKADNSGAIEEALRKSASDGGAAYIPEGEFAVKGWQGVGIDASMNGATLVGDGIRSVITGSDNCIFFGEDSAAYKDIRVANLRVTGGANGIRSRNGGPKADNQGVVIENVWADNHNKSGIRMDVNSAVIRYCSSWKNNEYQGISGWNVPPHNEPRSRIERCLVWDNGGNGLDPSEGSWVVDGCLTTQNGTANHAGGMKIAPESRYGSKKVHTTFKNTVSINNPQRGFYTVGDADALVEFENCLLKDNGEDGMVVLSGHEVKVGNKQPVYAVNNGRGGFNAQNGGKITGGTAFACGNSRNTIGNVNISDLTTSGCDTPSPADILGKG